MLPISLRDFSTALFAGVLQPLERYTVSEKST